MYRKKSHFQWQVIKLLSHPKHPAQKAPNPSHIWTLKNFFFSDILQNQVLRGQIDQKLQKNNFRTKNIFSGIRACFQTQTNLNSWWLFRQFLWVPPWTYAQEFIVSLQGSSKIQSRPQASPMQQMIQKFFGSFLAYFQLIWKFLAISDTPCNF